VPGPPSLNVVDFSPPASKQAIALGGAHCCRYCIRGHGRRRLPSFRRMVRHINPGGRSFLPCTELRQPESTFGGSGGIRRRSTRRRTTARSIGIQSRWIRVKATNVRAGRALRLSKKPTNQPIPPPNTTMIVPGLGGTSGLGAGILKRGGGGGAGEDTKREGRSARLNQRTRAHRIGGGHARAKAGRRVGGRSVLPRGQGVSREGGGRATTRARRGRRGR
jgi:hypothetical protein